MANGDQDYQNPTVPQNPAATGSSLTNQGPPRPTAADLIARAQRSLDPSGGIVTTGDPASNVIGGDLSSNMEKYGTHFPGSLPMNPTVGDRQIYKAFQWNEGAPAVGDRNGNIGRYDSSFPSDRPFNPTPADNARFKTWQLDNGIDPGGFGRHGRGAAGELAAHVATAHEALVAQHQARVDHDSQGILSVLHGLDYNDPDFEKSFLEGEASFPHYDAKLVAPILQAAREGRARAFKASQQVGGAAYDPGSHALEDFNDTLKQTGNAAQAKAAGNRTAKHEADLNKAYSSGLMHPDDFGDEQSWAKSGLFYTDPSNQSNYGKVNWNAVQRLTEQRARDQVKPAEVTQARKTVAAYSKRNDEDLTDQERADKRAAQSVLQRSTQQTVKRLSGTSGGPAGKSNVDYLTESLGGAPAAVGQPAAPTPAGVAPAPTSPTLRRQHGLPVAPTTIPTPAVTGQPVVEPPLPRPNRPGQ